MRVILYQPRIPQNAGNILRTCKAAGAQLAVVPPLGFNLSHNCLRRSHLDYGDREDFLIIEDLETHLQQEPTSFALLSSKVSTPYTECPYTEDHTLIFGSETDGFPPHFFTQYKEHIYTIPMTDQTRCLNLATSVGIVLYEAVRQTGLLSPTASK